MASVGSKNKARQTAYQQSKKTTEKTPYDDYVAPEIVQRYRDKWQKVHPGQWDEYTREAMKWYFDRIRKDIRIPQNKLLKQDIYQKRSGESKGLMGRMYFFEYEAQEAGDRNNGLYDRFPMVFFFNAYKNKQGKRVLLGLNLHYLQPKLRAAFLYQLLKLRADKRLNSRLRLKLQWNLIKGLGDKFAEETVHAYRIDRLQSKLIEISPLDWTICAALQLQRWEKPKEPTGSIHQSHARKLRKQSRK